MGGDGGRANKKLRFNLGLQSPVERRVGLPSGRFLSLARYPGGGRVLYIFVSGRGLAALATRYVWLGS